MRLLLATALALLALAAPAQAGVDAHAASARIAAELGVRVVYEPCPSSLGYAVQSSGCTFSHERIVYAEDPQDTTTLLHELGHQFAFIALGDTRQGLAGALRKFAVWTRVSGEPRNPIDVREQFADAYATCVLRQVPRVTEWGYQGDVFPTGYDYKPTVKTQRQVCAMIDRIGDAWRARSSTLGPTTSGS